MDKRIEEIARECAETYYCGRPDDYAQDVAAVAAALRRLRDEMNALPLPSPVSETRLKECALNDRNCGADTLQHFVGVRDRRDLLAHVAHLERLVRLLAVESEGLAFAAGLAEGRRLGAKEQHEADVKAAQDQWWDRPSGEGAAERVARAVKDAALVADAEGPP